MKHAIAGRLGRRSRAGLMGCAVLFGALLLVPQDVLAQKEKSNTKSSGSSGSSARSSSGSSRSSGARSSGSRSSSRSSAVSRSKSTGSRSKSTGSRSRAVTRSKSGSKPSPSRPRVSRPSSPRTKSTGSPRPSGGPSIRLPETRGEGPPRHLIDIVDTEGSFNKPGREPKGEYTHRRHRHHYPWYYPYYYPHRYYGVGYPYGFGYGYWRSYYPFGYPSYFYGPFGYFYTPHAYGYGRGSGGAAYGDGLGALDLNVKPKDAIVYVDGDAIGPVDRYDGYPSYLWLEPGTYRLSFYLKGYQTLTLEHTVLAEVVIAVKERLQPGVATPVEEILAETPQTFDSGETAEVPQANVGRLLLTVRPADAAVYLDGHFLGTAGELVQLSAGLVVEAGEHVLELVRPGYQTEEVPLVIPPGERIEVDLELQQR